MKIFIFHFFLILQMIFFSVLIHSLSLSINVFPRVSLYMNVCCMPLAGKRLDGGCWLVVTCPTYIWSGIISQYLLWVYMCFFFLNFPHLIYILKFEKVVLIICYAFQWISFLQLWCIFDFWCYLINKTLGNYEVFLHCCNDWPLIKWFKIKGGSL